MQGLPKQKEEKEMKQYQIILTGETPLIMHNDNLAYTEKIMQWRKAPENKEHSISGDDRTPPWTWIGYLYHDGKKIGINSDNILTMLREGGAKILTGKGKETYKKQTQAGIIIDGTQFDLEINGRVIQMEKFKDLVYEMDFVKHLEKCEELGFELLVKRAKVNGSKHIRVRPMFRDWVASGSITVINDEQSGLTKDVIASILNQAGALVGLCDWRPSSPRASGSFGKFSAIIEQI